MSSLEKIDFMSELRVELNQKITIGKQAYIKRNFPLAIKSFRNALELAEKHTPQLKGIIGFIEAYLALINYHHGVKEDILETVYTAIDFFPKKPSNPLAYVSILMDIGLEFQKVSLFECSIILLKKSLDLAKYNDSPESLENISVVSRSLAYSYYKVGNTSSAAKLFRIAADLTNKPVSAIDLYRNSAYLYYKVDRKEDALNILETAYDKSGIIGDTVAQKEIAHFQGTISYEVYKQYFRDNFISISIEYLLLALKKFEFLSDEFWIIKLLYEKAMAHESESKIWLRNKTLRKISQYDLTEKTEEYIIKAILLLVVHELEGENYSQADYYLKQIPGLKYEQLNKPLNHKIQELRKILEKSRQRTLLHSNIKFTRDDLDIPVEKLVQDEKTAIKTLDTREPVSVPDGAQSLDIPIQELVSEIKLSSRLISSQPTELLEEKAPEAITYDSSTSAPLQAPSIDVLQELFNNSEDFKVHTLDQTPTISEHQNEALESTPQMEIDSNQTLPIESNEESNATALESLFTAHQQSHEGTSSTTEFENEAVLEQNSSVVTPTPTSDSSSSRQIESDPSIVSRQLQKAGWTVQMNFTAITRRGAEPDIIAEKGIIRKSRKLIFFAENPTDAEICSFLLQANPESGEKIIYLIKGDLLEANIAAGIKFINQIDQLF